jgi:glutamyl-tRNA synthetase
VPKHLILYDMLGFEKPDFAHLPLLLNSKGQKLSKRFGDVSVESYKDQGFTPEALLNGIALLGWNPPQSQQEITDESEKFLKHEVLRV